MVGRLPEPDSLEDKVARLIAIEDIRVLIAKYAKAGDAHNDPNLMAQLFTADATWSAVGFGSYQGRDQIVTELARIGREQITWSLHFPVSPMVEISPDLQSATAFWWLWELMTMRHDGPDSEETGQWMGAKYEADFDLEPGGWRIRNLTLAIEKMVPFQDPS